MMRAFESPVDRHRHYNETAKAECAVCSLEAERDRLREALKMIAMPPIHVPEVSEGCEGCAAVAKAALDGVDVAGPISTTLAAYDAMREAATERDRLWAAARTLIAVIEAAEPGTDVFRLSGSESVYRLKAALYGKEGA